MITYIYMLCHPVTGEARYVGKTINPTGRYREHCKAKNKTYKDNWIRSLRPLKPTMHVVEEVESPGDWADSEQFWIQYMTYLGCSLTNLTQGGDGVAGYKHTEKHKKWMSEVQKGHKLTPEMKEKLLLANLGRSLSEETKRKMSEGHKGQTAWNRCCPLSDETKRKLSKAKKGQVAWNKGIPRSEETSRKIANTVKSKTRSIRASQGD